MAAGGAVTGAGAGAAAAEIAAAAALRSAAALGKADTGGAIAAAVVGRKLVVSHFGSSSGGVEGAEELGSVRLLCVSESASGERRGKERLHVLKLREGASVEAAAAGEGSAWVVGRTYKLKTLVRVEALANGGVRNGFSLGIDEGPVRGTVVMAYACGSTEARDAWLGALWRATQAHASARGRPLPKLIGADAATLARTPSHHAATAQQQRDRQSSRAAQNERDAQGDSAAALPGTVGPKHQRRSGTLDTKEPEQVLNLTEAEELDLGLLLDEYFDGGGGGHGDGPGGGDPGNGARCAEGGGEDGGRHFEVAAFKQRLEDELQAIEGANVHAILESKQAIASVLRSIDAAATRLDETDSWLEALNAHMTAMRADITAIEERNNELEMTARAHTRLLASCEHLVAVLHSSEYAERAIASCALTGEGAPMAARAAAEFGDALDSLVEGRDLPAPLRLRHGLPLMVASRVQELVQAGETFIRRAEGAVSEELTHCVSNTRGTHPRWNPMPDHERLHMRVREHLLVVPEADCLHGLVSKARRSLESDDDSPSPPASRHMLGPRVRLRMHYAIKASELLEEEADMLCRSLRSADAGMSPTQAYAEGLRKLLPFLQTESGFLHEAFATKTALPEADGIANTETTALDDACTEMSTRALGPILGLARWVGSASPAGALAAMAATEAWRVYGGLHQHMVPTLKSCTDMLRDAFVGHIKTLCEPIAAAEGGGGRLVEPLTSLATTTGKAIAEVEEQRQEVEKLAVSVAAVDTVDDSVTAEAFEVADMSVHLLMTAFTEATEGAASREKTDKRGALLRAESYRALAQALGRAAAAGAAAATEARSQAKARAAEQREEYLMALIGKNFGKPLEFLGKLEAVARTISADEVPLAAGFSKEEAERSLKMPMPPDKAVRALKAKITGHLGTENSPAVGRVWAAACELLPERWEELSKALRTSYRSRSMLSPTTEELRGMMLKLKS